MKSLEEREQEINRAAEMANLYLGACKDTLIMTSRKLVTGKSQSSSFHLRSLRIIHLMVFHAMVENTTLQLAAPFFLEIINQMVHSGKI